MKIKWEEDKLIIYYSMILDDILNYEIEDIKLFVKSLIVRLKNKYHLAIQGYYHLDIYINKIMILEFVQIDEYEEEVDLNITLHLNHEILVKHENINLVSGKSYYYKKKIYTKIEDIDINKEIEFIEFIYGKDTEKIKKDGILLR